MPDLAKPPARDESGFGISDDGRTVYAFLMLPWDAVQSAVMRNNSSRPFNDLVAALLARYGSGEIDA